MIDEPFLFMRKNRARALKSTRLLNLKTLKMQTFCDLYCCVVQQIQISLFKNMKLCQYQTLNFQRSRLKKKLFNNIIDFFYDNVVKI